MNTTNTTIQCQSGHAYGGAPVITRDTSSPRGLARNIDAYFANRGVTSTFANIAADTQGKLSAVVNVAGENCHLSNITQEGQGRIVTLNAAVGAVCDMLIDTAGLSTEYSIWGALDGKGDRGPTDCQILRFDINMPAGLHAIRLHKHTNLVLGDDKLSLPGTTFAGRINYTSPYDGAAITLKEGKNAKLIRIQTFGPVGFGPNDAEIPAAWNSKNTAIQSGAQVGDPNWEALRLDGLEVDRCEFHVGKRYFTMQAGCLNVNVHDTKIIADPTSACLRLNPAWKGPTTGWPASTGKFTNVAFTGAKLIDDSGKPLLSNWTFVGCTLNGKPLDAHGNVI